MITFCTNCGQRHEFSASKPKYCGGCGVSFGAAAVSPSSIPQGRNQGQNACATSYNESYGGKKSYDNVRFETGGEPVGVAEMGQIAAGVKSEYSPQSRVVEDSDAFVKQMSEKIHNTKPFNFGGDRD